MAQIPKSRRANAGGCRGGCGAGGYEQTDPDYDAKRIAKLRMDFDALENKWRPAFLIGLNFRDKYLVLHRDIN